MGSSHARRISGTSTHTHALSIATARHPVGLASGRNRMSKNRSGTIFAALALLFSATTVVFAQEGKTVDVEKMVMGHAKFIQRCVEDRVPKLREETKKYPVLVDAHNAFSQTYRQRCENFYEGINVCMKGGSDKASNRMSKLISGFNAQLSNPLTPATTYEIAKQKLEDLNIELSVLKKLKDKPSEYCN